MNVIHIDQLIDIVKKGGLVKTGINIFNNHGVLLLDKDVLVKSVNVLLTIKQQGVTNIKIDYQNSGGVWDPDGKPVKIGKSNEKYADKRKKYSFTEVDKKIKEISYLKNEAKKLHQSAKKNIKKVFTDIKQNNGKFNGQDIEDTVDAVFSFLNQNTNAFSYLAKEIFSFDDYLYNHSVNVCTIGAAVLKKFNDEFGKFINEELNQKFVNNGEMDFINDTTSFILYYPDEIKEITMGYFLHDMGKTKLPEKILNKNGPLSKEEFLEIKKHSYEYGPMLLDKNKIESSMINNIVTNHHAALFTNEDRVYPLEKNPIELPPYVKICKLVDIYDAMTSKRSYKEAINPIVVVTDIFRKYAGKDRLLQLILHSFVKVVGIYPPGSVVFLQNGQMAYIVDSNGPIFIPFTDRFGKTKSKQQDAIDLSQVKLDDVGFNIDRRKPPLSPLDAYKYLPDYLLEKKVV